MGEVGDDDEDEGADDAQVGLGDEQGLIGVGVDAVEDRVRLARRERGRFIVIWRRDWVIEMQERGDIPPCRPPDRDRAPFHPAPS